MRLNLFLTALVLLLLGADVASAQGLSAIRSRSDMSDPAPMAYTVGVAGGYDSLNYKGSNSSDFDSAFIQGGLGATFSDKDRVTPWSLGVDLGIVNYFDDTHRGDNTDYSARLVFDVSHAFSERLKLVDNFYISYEVEPNFGLGASTALRNGQYAYGYNNLAVSYAWSKRFSTTTSYTLDAIQYDDSRIGNFEDRMSHVASQQFAWDWTKTSKFVAEYRYRTVRYQHADTDFSSHYILAGIDKAWSERTTGSFRAGAELYKGTRSSETAPYFEAALHHQSSEKTHLTAFTSLGFDGSELGAYGSRYSYRLGVMAQHQLSKRFSVNGGVNYAYSTFQGVGGAADVNEHEVSATAGLGYMLWDNISLDANYSYTLLTSDDILREYDRNRFSLGLSANF